MTMTPDLSEARHIHLVGAGGAGMGAIADVLSRRDVQCPHPGVRCVKADLSSADALANSPELRAYLTENAATLQPGSDAAHAGDRQMLKQVLDARARTLYGGPDGGRACSESG